MRSVFGLIARKDCVDLVRAFRQKLSVKVEMILAEYQELLSRIPYGKRLPGALYVFRDEKSDFGEQVNQLIARSAAIYGVGPEFNVVKFRTNELGISFLAYPDFFEVPHPVLRQGITIDLARGKARRADYSENANPPILHRKEAFLPVDHPMRAEFAALTAAEEAAGLYREIATIGFKLNWDRLLAEKGLTFAGHCLKRVDSGEEDPVALLSVPAVQRHKTALLRYELSKPVRSLLEYGQLRTGRTFFDYGCGQGTDIDGLRNLGHEAEGWDPAHRHETPKKEADVVNLGYVLNVIEDPAERLDTLLDAFRHARRLLVVSTLIRETVETANAATFRDGVLTKRNTFQKYFEQQELQQYIEDALDVSAVPVALGIFYVFRSPADQQDFISARSRRIIDWTQIASRLGARPRAARKSRSEILYEMHKELLDSFWAVMIQLGRMPAPEEFAGFSELRDAVGSPKRALRIFVQRGGMDELQRAREHRCNDLLVYLAMSNLRKRVPFGHLSLSLRLDIKAFYGNHRRALEKGLELLYAAGDPGEIELACEGLKAGWQDEQSLYVHRSVLDELPPLLRAYVGCAATLFGDVRQADVIKLHKTSGKVTFLVYDDFERKALPELRHRIKVNLRTRWVQVFDHSNERQLLFFKERFVAPNHPRRAGMERVSIELRKLGLNDKSLLGPDKESFDRLLEAAGLNADLQLVTLLSDDD